MAELRLYKDIYRIDYNSSGQTYTLVNANVITANVVNLSNSNIVESPAVNLQSTGVYFVSLNPVLYSYDNIYEVLYTVNYVLNAPVRILKTRFKFRPFNISSDYGIDLEKMNNIIEYQLDNSDRIIIEVINVNN